jgi:hypothetical protein
MSHVVGILKAERWVGHLLIVTASQLVNIWIHSTFQPRPVHASTAKKSCLTSVACGHRRHPCTSAMLEQ